MADRGANAGKFINQEALENSGLNEQKIRSALNELNDLMDSVDLALLSHGVERLSQIVELANLSSMLGNIFAAAVAGNSRGVFRRNGPHKYPDLLSNDPNISNIEVKVALETNKPKGHLIKTGKYLTCRYVLCDEDGKAQFDKEDRGRVPWVWEIRYGTLEEHHFSVSNTDGDSGKTAVVNKDGMDALKVVYIDGERLPYTQRSRIRTEVLRLIGDA
jgi:hypothetical protein